MNVNAAKLADATERSWFQEPMVWMVITIPLTAVLVGIGMLTMSIRSYDGLVVDDYYKRGKEINRVLKRTQYAIDQGISAALTYSAQDSKKRPEQGKVVVSLAHNPDYMAPHQIRFKLLHRTRAGLDQSVTLERYGDGVYRADFDMPKNGHWLARIETEKWWIGGNFALPNNEAFTLTAQP